MPDDQKMSRASLRRSDGVLSIPPPPSKVTSILNYDYRLLTFFVCVESID